VDWGSLERAIDGDVAIAGSPAYAERHRPSNARFLEIEPQAVVSCAAAPDVSETISFARRHGLDVAVRSGGHSFAGHSSTRGVLIDVGPMRSLSVSGGAATVGAGARLGEVYAALEEHDLAIPAGTCPDVGVAGLTLGGGLGILGRTHGVTSDSLVAAEIVLGDGSILTCDASHEPDLFWALRGAGSGNFGVVTSLVFHPVPAPDGMNVHLVWPFSRAADVVRGWQSWAPNGPDGLAASLKVTAGEELDGPPSVDVYAALLGNGSGAADVFDELVARAGSDPVSSSMEHLSFRETRRFWARLGEGGEGAAKEPDRSEPVLLFSKSEFFRRPLPSETVAALLESFASDRAPGASHELDFMPWGGAYNRPEPDATAFVHRREQFLLKHAVVLQPDASASDQEAAHRKVARSWASVHPWGSGRAFQNFADPDLANWADAYYGSNLDRLVRVKRRYDPENLFRFAQSLRPG
jgi:FAD/FMN-containing dehydrogenase